MKRPLAWRIVAWAAVFAVIFALDSPAWADEMLALGSHAPDFCLTDVVTGKSVSRDDFSNKKALLVIFICRHCPYVQHVKQALAQLAKEYEPKGLAVAAISSNDPAAYPQDAPASLKELAQQEGFIFPVLFDESQAAARLYGAVCTPDPFLFDQKRRLVYHGQLDDTRPGGARSATADDLRAAVDAVLAGQPGLGQGLRFGFRVGLLVAVPSSLICCAIMPIPFSLAVNWALGGMAQILIAGAVAGLIYR